MNFIVTIDLISLKVRSDISILQACEIANISIPRFCYHQRLSIAGNCRMCLVEVLKLPKLQASCAVPLVNNMIIFTKSPLVLKAREGILEFLLINHPLDCPICDQGGECDLQDQSLFYGGDKNRYKEFKRATEDKYYGPLIKTVMTRCIHCTRCIRFAHEIVGIPDFGTSGRGNSIEINFYIEKLFFSELSGNVIDLCPVGALTSKPSAFLLRPWESKSIESIDIFDSIHSNVKIDVKGYDIIRILPRRQDSINEEWISDKIRFAFDGLFLQRLTNPLLKDKQGQFNLISWSEAYDLIYYKISCLFIKKIRHVGLFVGPFCDFESLVSLKQLTHLLNSSVFSNNASHWLDSDFHNLFKFNTFLSDITKSDFCLILGTNPRTDGILLNYHLRKRYLQGNFKVIYFGYHLNLTFPTLHLGCSVNRFFSLLEGNNSFCKYLRKSKKPLIIIGKTFLNKIKSLNFNLLFKNLVSNLNQQEHFTNTFSFFNSNSKDFCFYDLSMNHNYNLCYDKFDLSFIVEEFTPLSILFFASFTIFLGHHGCFNAQKSDLILPTTSFIEKTAKFSNCEGRYQDCRLVTLPLGQSKDCSVILSTIVTNQCLDFYSLNNYSCYLLPSCGYFVNQIYSSFFTNSFFSQTFLILSNSYFLSSLSDNFYKMDIISRYSLNMSKSAMELLDKTAFKF